jgi:hypothetical protein
LISIRYDAEDFIRQARAILAGEDRLAPKIEARLRERLKALKTKNVRDDDLSGLWRLD